MSDTTLGYYCKKCGKAEYEPGDCVCNRYDDTNPKDRLGTDKPNIWTIPPAAIAYLSKIMELGAKKYGAFNWRSKKVKWTIYYSAAMRHMMAALDGEEIDVESGYPHEAHAMACMAILLDARATGNLVDDRPVKGNVAELMRRMTTAKKIEEAEKHEKLDPLIEAAGAAYRATQPVTGHYGLEYTAGPTQRVVPRFDTLCFSCGRPQKDGEHGKCRA